MDLWEPPSLFLTFFVASTAQSQAVEAVRALRLVAGTASGRASIDLRRLLNIVCASLNDSDRQARTTR